MTLETPCMISGIAGHVNEGIRTPITRLRPPASLDAVMLGTNDCSSMRRKMRSRVAGSTSGFWFNTRETVALETPAKRAMSRIVIFTSWTTFWLALLITRCVVTKAHCEHGCVIDIGTGLEQ